MKYKVGDKVKIREDLVVDMGRDGVRVTESMLKYAGKVVRIRKKFNLIGVYEIDADNKEYVWTDEMLEDVESDVMMIEIYQDGNKVIAKKDGKVSVAKCSPEDKFDIFTGVRIAIERLEEKCKP